MKMNRRRIYIAGPMTGHPDFNYPTFHAAAEALRALGHEVLNPAENKPASDDIAWTDWMRLGLTQVIASDAIALLPGWEDSRGATLENYVGICLGLDVRPLSEWLASAS
jgi:hypothetical protein